MNAEKFDIEKMLEADAESIEIDLDFKAKLKADIMKNNSSFENNNIIDFNAKTSEKTINKSKKFKPYKKYLQIASSFAIVGLIGFRVGVGNFGIAKMYNPNDEIKVVSTEIIPVKNNEAASVNDVNNSKGEEKEVATQTEVAINSGNEENVAEQKVNVTNENKGNDNVVVEKPKSEDNTLLAESEKENVDYNKDDSDRPDEQLAYENTDNKITEPNIDETHDEMLTNGDNSHFAGGNTSSETEDEKNELNLVSYAEENAVDFYYGTLSMIEDEEFILENNNVYIKNEDSKELVFTQEDNYDLKGIKKVNDNEVLLYKVSLGNEENEHYQLSKFDLSTKEENLLVVEAESIVLNNTYDKLAFEINNNIVIKDIKTEKQEKALNGKNIAWSPDGKYLSYVKTVREDEEGEKIKTYSLFVVYDSEENKEITLAENELIVMNDEELIGAYEYGENLWSNDNKCIYVVRENRSIINDIDGNKNQVIKLTVMN